MLVYQRVNHIQSWDVYHQLVQDFASFTIHGTVLWISLKETHADWTNGPGDFPWNPWDFFNWSNHVMGMGMSYNVMACGWLWSIHTIRIYQSILLGYIQLIPILWLCYALKRWDHVGRFFFRHASWGWGSSNDVRPHSEKQFNTPEKNPAPHHALLVLICLDDF